MTSNHRLPEIKFDVPSQEVFDALAEDALPLGVHSGASMRTFHRDLYLDTPDRALAERNVRCRIRISADDRRELAVEVRDVVGAVERSRAVYRALVSSVDPKDIVHGESEPARRLRGIVDPGRLRVVQELETERRVRRVRGRGWWPPGWHFEFVLDHVSVGVPPDAVSFRELKIRHRHNSRPSLDELVAALQDRYPINQTLLDKPQRALKVGIAAAAEARRVGPTAGHEVAVLALSGGRVALQRAENVLSVPVGPGSGEAACREVLRSVLAGADSPVRRLGLAEASASRPRLEVWAADASPEDVAGRDGEGLQWFTLPEVTARIGSPLMRDPRTLAALAVAMRTGALVSEPASPPPADPGADATRTLADLQRPALSETSLDAAMAVPDQFVNVELSWVAFNARVLELAEDPSTPFLARFRFLAIFSANLDEFYMVRVGILKHAVARGLTDRSLDGMTPQEQLDAIAVRVAPLVARQQECYARLVAELPAHGWEVRGWEALDDDARDRLRDQFIDQIFPTVTPHAMTQAPGHPFPHLANLSVSLAAVMRNEGGGRAHFGHVRIPAGHSRFLRDGRVLVPVEDVIAANLNLVYPERTVDAAHAFRVTRSGDLQINEEAAANLLVAIADEVKKRPFGAAVRLEVDAAMPPEARELLERELQIEVAEDEGTPLSPEIVEAAHLVDLTCLHELAALPIEGGDYPVFKARRPLDPTRSVFAQISERDILVHHPYDAFDATVERFLVEAADDPDVVAIKLTLYRSGNQSAIVDALTRAAQSGKDVSVFVELKARFDEERNIAWARKLEAADIHVVYGLVRLKTHAKTTLVVRREGETLRRYVHIGTGNYNAATARFYTDLGLLSSRAKLGVDLHDLFNELTGSSRPPESKFRRLLVAPKRMRRRFLKLIEREVAHARSGRGGRIRIKLNGIADAEIIGALYEASQAGVEIDLIVRGICALRPGVPGLSEHIRVISILGRFLEHARIFHFGNGGRDEYYIGSADWRPRNLRRRVEVVTPVVGEEECSYLDHVLELELVDAYAWEMQSDGSYARREAPPGGRSAQQILIDEIGRPA